MANGNGDVRNIPQWAVLLACGLLAFMGQYVFVLLTSKTASNEQATHAMAKDIAVQRADFDAFRKQGEQSLLQLNGKIDQLSADVNKRLDRMEQRQEETQRLLLQQRPTGPR